MSLASNHLLLSARIFSNITKYFLILLLLTNTLVSSNTLKVFSSLSSWRISGNLLVCETLSDLFVGDQYFLTKLIGKVGCFLSYAPVRINSTSFGAWKALTKKGPINEFLSF